MDGRGARRSGNGEHMLGEDANGGVALLEIDAERGVDSSRGEVVEGAVTLEGFGEDEVADGGEPEASDEGSVVGEGAVDEGAEALVGGAGGGVPEFFQLDQGAVPGRRSPQPEIPGGSEPLVALGDVADDPEQVAGPGAGGSVAASRLPVKVAIPARTASWG